MSKVYHDHIKDGLRELSSLDMQRRLWLSTGEPEWSSLGEATCRLFDDSGLDVAFDKRETVFSPEADTQLRRLGARIRSIDMMRPPSDIIEDSAMEQVRATARQLLRDLYDE
jgi:hypothetical protein